MDCPRCLGRTHVLDTRKREPFNAWVTRLKKDWPDIVYRRRECTACAHLYETVELPVADLRAIMRAEGGKVRGHKAPEDYSGTE